MDDINSEQIYQELDFYSYNQFIKVYAILQELKKEIENIKKGEKDGMCESDKNKDRK